MGEFSSTIEHAVVIVGAGPTGLTLAAELALAGIDVLLVERRPSQERDSARAGGLHARTLEILDQRGVADRFIAQGQKFPAVSFHRVRLDIGDFPSRHNYLLALAQHHSERILAAWVDELAVPILRGREVTAFTQDSTGVHITLSDGVSLRSQYIVGCDGGRSLIRKSVGIDFPGSDPTTSWLIAEVETTEEPAWGFHDNAIGTHAFARAEDGKRVRMVLTERQVESSREPTLQDLRDALLAACGTDYGIHSPTSISRFTDMTRQAAAYRVQRVLLAGDSAHVHPPLGGQGLNIGVQDAMNLGWKLAQVVRRTAPESLLDTYQAERHPVAARVLRNTMAQSALRRTDNHTKALGGYVAEFLHLDEVRRRMAGEMSGLDIHYDLGEGHPLLGRRIPDLDLVTTGRPLRLFTLLHRARPVFLNLGERGAFDIAPWADRVPRIDAQYDGPWELPSMGPVPAPQAVLVRPDGYVAWVAGQPADGDPTALTKALTTWFGPRSAAESTLTARIWSFPAPCGNPVNPYEGTLR